MIIEIKGDAVMLRKHGLVDGLMHCCNAKGVMGTGIAAQIKYQFPDSYRAYYDFCHKNSIKDLMGRVPFNEKDLVFNIIGQETTGSTGRFVHYGALARGMTHCQYLASSRSTPERPFKLAMPKLMGCALAGGDWEVVRELVDGIFYDKNVDLYIVEFQPS